MGLLAFLLVLVPLVVIHELGHFIMAKLGGIRVTRFAVGFGKTLFSFHYKGTEYCWNLLPFGGYVDFMGELVYTNEIPEDVAHFYNRPKWLRFLVLVMGPLFNLILAFLIFWGVFAARPFKAPIYKFDTYTVGAVAPDSTAAEAGLQAGDSILSINGEPVADVESVHEFLLINPGQVADLVVQRGDSKQNIQFKLEKDYVEGHGIITFAPSSRAMVDWVKPEMAAARAGLTAPAVVTQLNQKPVNVFQIVPAILRESTSSFTLDSSQGPIPVNPRWSSSRGWAFDFHLEPQFVDGSWSPTGYAFKYDDLAARASASEGLPFQLDAGQLIFSFTPSPVDEGWSFSVGITFDPGVEGDKTFRLYDQEHTYDELVARVEKAGAKPLSLTLEGRDEPLVITPEWDENHWMVGISFAAEYQERDLDWKGAFFQGWNSFKRNSTLIYESVRKLIIGELPLKSLSGPVGVARVAGQAMDAGLLPFIMLMAILSLNLGLLNLLPIPVLDGGEIFVLLVEWISRKDFSLATKMRIKMVGFFFIIGLMGIVLVTDVMKVINSMPG